MSKRTCLSLCNTRNAFMSRNRWHLTDWSPCSKLCGKGEQTRQLLCRERISHYRYHELLDSSHCSQELLPDDITLSRSCNKVICRPSWDIVTEFSAVIYSCLFKIIIALSDKKCVLLVVHRSNKNTDL